MIERSAWRVTYEIVTPESAEQGDAAERGFVTPGEWRTPAAIGKATEGVGMGLREALRLVDPQEDSGRWLSEADGRLDYETGAEERRSLHPPESITAASYARLKRLCGVRL